MGRHLEIFEHFCSNTFPFVDDSLDLPIEPVLTFQCPYRESKSVYLTV